MRRCAKRDVIPADLQTYDPATWIQAAIDADDVLIRHIPVAERPTHWYVVRIIAPHSYRQALWASTGRRAGDHHFSTVLTVKGGAAPALCADA